MISDNEDDDFLDFQVNKRGQINMNLLPTSQKSALEVVNSFTVTNLLNRNLDQYNAAESAQGDITILHDVEFQNYFLKNKERNVRSNVFNEVRDLLIERGYNDISEIRDRQQKQIMVVRVIQKVDNSTFIIEDQFSKDKLIIKEGIMWVGMICAIQAKWLEGNYKLERVIDLSRPIPKIKAHLTANMAVNRMMILRGPFRQSKSNEDKGIRIITKYMQKLKKSNIIINQLIIMGPILHKDNQFVRNFQMQRTFQQQFDYIIALLKAEVHKLNSEIQVYIIPSLQDITSLHPIPQPSLSAHPQNKFKYLSNPSSLGIQIRKSSFKVDFINYDVINMIQKHKLGTGKKDIRTEMMEAYFKQPFYLTNTTTNQDPFDELNFGKLFNSGQFGDLVVFSSNMKPPFLNEVDGRIILNIGSLGIDYHYLNKKYIVLVSVYEGNGPVSDRTKIDQISSDFV